MQDLWEGKTVQQREVTTTRCLGMRCTSTCSFLCWVVIRTTGAWCQLSLVDITARKKAEAYLEYLGKHDVLTQLRNRAFYAEELTALRAKGPWPFAVIAIDLNGLKAINDEQGHAAGDAMLRRAGEVLAKAVDAPACAARWVAMNLRCCCRGRRARRCCHT